MADEETKETGETGIAFTEEERLYQQAKQLYEKAGKALKEANSALEQWKADHKEERISPLNAELQALEKRVDAATLNLQITGNEVEKSERRWKDARGEAGLLEHAGKCHRIDLLSKMCL
jgi:flagellar biosynthesis chaperone FliJ